MLKRNLLVIGLLGYWVIGLSGCATTIKTRSSAVGRSAFGGDEEFQALKNRVSLLENQIISKDSQIANLTYALEKEKEARQDLLKTVGEQAERLKDLTKRLQEKKKQEVVFPKSKTKAYYSFVIRIQAALKNAGFDPGLIDGKMGNRTRAALKGFQKANGLTENGQVDKQTWILLRKYL